MLSAANSQLICASQGFNATISDNGSGNVSVTVPAGAFAIFATKNVTGIDDSEIIADGNNVTVFGTQGQIIINSEYTNAAVYDLSGRAFGTENLPAGIYIVRVDGTSHKVVVR